MDLDTNNSVLEFASGSSLLSYFCSCPCVTERGLGNWVAHGPKLHPSVLSLVGATGPFTLFLRESELGLHEVWVRRLYRHCSTGSALWTAKVGLSAFGIV